MGTSSTQLFENQLSSKLVHPGLSLARSRRQQMSPFSTQLTPWRLPCSPARPSCHPRPPPTASPPSPPPTFCRFARSPLHLLRLQLTRPPPPSMLIPMVVPRPPLISLVLPPHYSHWLDRLCGRWSQTDWIAGPRNGMAWVRALCMLIHVVDILYGKMVYERRSLRCALFRPPPCLPACLPPPAAALVCVHVPAASRVDGRALMLTAEAHLCCDLPADCRNGGRVQQVANSRVA